MNKFYAVGIGMGELTCHAKEILQQADRIFAPVTKEGSRSRALDMLPETLHEKAEMLLFPMQMNLSETEYLSSGVLSPVTDLLDQGKTVVMITLGDVSLYSTAAYVRQAIAEMGYETEIIPGIPSFVDGAAKAQISLCEKQESLLILPGVTSPENIRKALDFANCIIIMKAGKSLSWLIPLLEEMHLKEQTVMFYHLGMPDEYIGIPIEKQSYFITLVIRTGGRL